MWFDWVEQFFIKQTWKWKLCPKASFGRSGSANLEQNTCLLMQMVLSKSPVCGILAIGLAISIMGPISLFLQHFHNVSNVPLSYTVLYQQLGLNSICMCVIRSKLFKTIQNFCLLILQHAWTISYHEDLSWCLCLHSPSKQYDWLLIYFQFSNREIQTNYLSNIGLGLSI